jgi:hypothetical protein
MLSPSATPQALFRKGVVVSMPRRKAEGTHTIMQGRVEKRKPAS